MEVSNGDTNGVCLDKGKKFFPEANMKNRKPSEK